MKNFDYVILGAGLGGLSAAACLTRQEIYSDENIWYAYHQRILSGTARRQYVWCKTDSQTNRFKSFRL